MNRHEAANKGLRTYNDGKLCRRGHNSERYTSTGNCIQCLKEDRMKFSVMNNVAGSFVNIHIPSGYHDAVMAFVESCRNEARAKNSANIESGMANNPLLARAQFPGVAPTHIIGE